MRPQWSSAPKDAVQPRAVAVANATKKNLWRTWWGRDRFVYLQPTECARDGDPRAISLVASETHYHGSVVHGDGAGSEQCGMIYVGARCIARAFLVPPLRPRVMPRNPAFHESWIGGTVSPGMRTRRDPRHRWSHPAESPTQVEMHAHEEQTVRKDMTRSTRIIEHSFHRLAAGTGQ